MPKLEVQKAAVFYSSVVETQCRALQCRRNDVMCILYAADVDLPGLKHPAMLLIDIYILLLNCS